jgi:hypothetical protein
VKSALAAAAAACWLGRRQQRDLLQEQQQQHPAACLALDLSCLTALRMIQTAGKTIKTCSMLMDMQQR